MTGTRGPWFSLLAPIFAFGGEGAFGWWVGTEACGETTAGQARLMIAAMTVVMLGISGVALRFGIGRYRTVRAAAPPTSDRDGFLAFGGVFVSASFLIGIAWFGISAVLVTTCGWMR
jgi:hypothetical protein